MKSTQLKVAKQGFSKSYESLLAHKQIYLDKLPHFASPLLSSQLSTLTAL